MRGTRQAEEGVPRDALSHMRHEANRLAETSRRYRQTISQLSKRAYCLREDLDRFDARLDKLTRLIQEMAS